MTDTLINFFTETLAGLPKELIVFIISMVPILELRGGIVAASLLGVSITKAIPICIIGNIIPIPFIMMFIRPIFDFLKKTKLLKGLVEKIEKKSLEKSDKIKKYEFWGLLLFVGIPLPGTGAWTGSLIAVLLEIKPKKAVLPIFLGLILATIIMCIVSYFIPWVIKSI
ncbi:MAG: small multi-drug export protein [Ruminococcus sp.]|nr:small multi-drug export protein [Ruminococcus sp.]